MIIIHAGFTEGRLYLWGETPAVQARPLSRGRNRAPGMDSYMYDPGATGLHTACAELEQLHAIAAREPINAVIHLPSISGTPLASTPLIADPPAPDAHPAIHPFALAAVEIQPEEITALMSLVIAQTPLAPGIIAGSTLKFWSEAFRLAVWLVVRQQFLPGLYSDGRSFRARWEPVLSREAERRINALQRHMPDACRALTINGTTHPGTPAQNVLSDVIGIMVDALVRQSAIPELIPRRRRKRAPSPPSFISPDERWLGALRSESGLIAATRAEMKELTGRIAAWKRPFLVLSATPFRLCFRLEEPLPDMPQRGRRRATPWTVRYLLQSTADPSLLIDVAVIWNARNLRSMLPDDIGANPREHLLAELGRASRLLPEIEASLRDPAPEGYLLDTVGAHRFLQESAWLLEHAGFGVLLPSWWTRRGTRHRLVARAVVNGPKLKAQAGLTLDAIATVDWEVALGDERIPLDELQKLADLKAPLVRMRGEWVELNPAEIEAALEYWKNRKQPREEVTLRDVVRMALGIATPPGGMEFTGIAATGVVRQMLARLNGSEPPEEIPLPSGFHGTLRPYQERGFAWLAFLQSLGLGACLADDMGLGKTIQTLALLQHGREQGEQNPTLLICPTSVMGNWRKEAERFTPELPVMMHHGTTRKKGAAFMREAARCSLVVTSYSLLHRDADVLNRVAWNGIILDEAQNIKNPETRQARAARALRSSYRIALTGTPVENHIGDLWSIMEFLNPGFLGSHAAFKRTFFLPIQAEHDPAATERLKKLTAPFILRRLKTDKSIIADLPKKQEMKVFCTLTREQASLYQAVVDEMTGGLAGVEGIQRRGMILAGISKLKQVCNHPTQLLRDNSAIPGRSGKLDRLTEMLEEALAAGDRALVFTQFAEMGDIIKRHLQETFGVEALFLHGGTTPKQRDRMVERFQAKEDSAPPIFILSLKAGGSGLNLTAAAHVFHFDRWWNPAVENQATDRAFRIGQRRNVQVHKFICTGTVEEKIDEMIGRKQEIASNIIGGGEAWLAMLPTEELRQILALRADALGE